MVGKRIDSVSQPRMEQLFIWSIGIVVMLFLVLGYVFVYPNLFADTQVQALGTLGGLVLSFLLLLVYIDMSQTQDEQHEFLQDLNSPHVRLKSLRYTGTDSGRPQFTVSLSNLGSDSATELDLTTDTKLLTGFDRVGTEEDYQLEGKEEEEWKIESRTTSLTRRETIDDDSTLISRGDYLEEGETNQDFDFTVQFEPAENTVSKAVQ